MSSGPSGSETPSSNKPVGSIETSRDLTPNMNLVGEKGMEPLGIPGHGNDEKVNTIEDFPVGNTKWQIPVIGKALDMLGRFEALKPITQDICTIEHSGNRFKEVIIVHPDGVRPLFQYGVEEKKGQFFDVMGQPDFLGDSVFTDFGETWEIKAGIMHPVFASSAIKKAEGTFWDTVGGRTKSLRESGGGEVDVLKLSTKIALDSLTNAIFSRQFNEDQTKQVTDLIHPMENTLGTMMAFGESFTTKFTPFYPELKAKRARLAQTIEEFIAERKVEIEAGTAEDDMLTKLIRGKYKNPKTGEETSLTNSQIIDQVVTFVFAGHETTSSALSWALKELVHEDNKDVLRKIREEIAQFIPDPTKKEDVLENLDKLKYLKAVVKETLRLHPPIPFLSRDVPKDGKGGLTLSIGGKTYNIPEGTTTTLNIYNMHRDPRWYKHPNKFDPEHFFDEEQVRERDKHAYAPFGDGKRKCMGNNFATTELEIALIRMLTEFNIKPGKGYRGIKEVVAATLKPNWLNLIFEPRNAVQALGQKVAEP